VRFAENRYGCGRVSKPRAASPQKSDGSAIHPYHLVSKGAAAPRRPIFYLLSSISCAKRLPKPQAQRAVSGTMCVLLKTATAAGAFPNQGRLRPKSRTARRSIPTISFRRALPRRAALSSISYLLSPARSASPNLRRNAPSPGRCAFAENRYGCGRVSKPRAASPQKSDGSASASESDPSLPSRFERRCRAAPPPAAKTS
jgi:hypothetical protein